MNKKFIGKSTKSVVVLHSDAMAGISIHVEDGSNDELLRSVAIALTIEN